VRARTGGVPESDTGGGAGLSRVRLEHDEAEGMTGRPQRPVTAGAAQAGGTLAMVGRLAVAAGPEGGPQRERRQAATRLLRELGRLAGPLRGAAVAGLDRVGALILVFTMSKRVCNLILAHT
jgi:hypothetical protein